MTLQWGFGTPDKKIPLYGRLTIDREGGLKDIFSYLQKHSVCMFPNKSFVFLYLPHGAVLHVFLFANDFLKKMWMYKILQIRPIFAKFQETSYREKLQYLRGTASCKGTTKLEGKVDSKLEGVANSFIFANLGVGNKLKCPVKNVYSVKKCSVNWFMRFLWSDVFLFLNIILNNNWIIVINYIIFAIDILVIQLDRT